MVLIALFTIQPFVQEVHVVLLRDVLQSRHDRKRADLAVLFPAVVKVEETLAVERELGLFDAHLVVVHDRVVNARVELWCIGSVHGDLLAYANAYLLEIDLLIFILERAHHIVHVLLPILYHFKRQQGKVMALELGEKALELLGNLEVIVVVVRLLVKKAVLIGLLGVPLLILIHVDPVVLLHLLFVAVGLFVLQLGVGDDGMCNALEAIPRVVGHVLKVLQHMVHPHVEILAQFVVRRLDFLQDGLVHALGLEVGLY
mmetsp:Transcript_17313/g.49492  ORF Transcript_17313/g.49492 Transcript_17313/m.49492 type:complete len:258 (+) Transcript_17313:276-1049(+)